MKYKIKSTGNVIIADQAFVDAHYPDDYELITEVVVAPPENPQIWWIDEGPFKDRLGMDALAIAASTHDACKGVVGMLSGRQYVNLKDPKTAMMLDILIATNQPAANPIFPGSGPMTPTKKTAILNAATTEFERHIKGLQP